MKSSANQKTAEHSAHNQEKLPGNIPGRRADLTKITDNLSSDEKVRILTNELKAVNEELKEKDRIIKCIQDIYVGIGLRSSAANFYNIKDKACLQLIEGLQTLFEELEDFIELVNFDDKSKYEPPMPPISKLMNLLNVGKPIMPHIDIASSNGPSTYRRTNSKLAAIRWNWEDHNLKILDLIDRLKAAYTLLSEQDPAKSIPKGPISVTSVKETYNAPHEEAMPEPSLWYLPKNGALNAKHKSILLSLAEDESDSDSDDEVYRAKLTKAHPPIVETKPAPDWLDEIGEIRIVPVEAELLHSPPDEAETPNDAKNTRRVAVDRRGTKSGWTEAFSPHQVNAPLESVRPASSDYSSDVDSMIC